MPPTVDGRKGTGNDRGSRNFLKSGQSTLTTGGHKGGGPGAGPSPASSGAPGRPPPVGVKAPHNAYLNEQNAQKNRKIEFNPEMSSRNGSAMNGAVSPVPTSPQRVDNTKGIGLEQERAPSTRAVSPVIYDLPRNKQGDFERIVLLNPLDKKYECPVCHDILRYPVQFEDCGHRVCSSCLVDLLKVSPKCPIDGKGIKKESTFPDSAISREIGGLKCRCNNSIIGCQWIGEVRTVAGHIEAECRFVSMECPNKCGDTFERRHLDTHISDVCLKRVLHCPHCSDIVPAQEMDLHEKECPSVKRPCPNDCGAKRTKAEMEKHLQDECSSNKVHCTYYEAGCLHMCPRVELNKHLRTDALIHVDLVAKLLFETRKLVNKHQGFIGGTNDFLNNLGSSGLSFEKAIGSQLLWRIEGVQEKVRQAKSNEKVTQYSKQFYSGPHGYKLIAATCFNGTGGGAGQFLPIYIFVCKGEYDALLPWPFKAELTLTLMDVRPDFDAREDITYTFKPDPDDPTMKEALLRPNKDRNPYFGVNRFAPLEVVRPQSNYIENDVMFIQVVVSQEDIPAL
ncbi:TNF receptor-associated factor 4-like [Convolutriloba macropyga]|uniref:TNF receptor-associated factor 4-like n=1 Tax=Convolutriloba macropyga TaxID=536237 RepID=UPI003F51F450